MTTRRRRLRATMPLVLLSLCASPAPAASGEWEQADQITRDRVARAKATLHGGGTGTGNMLAEMAEKARRDEGRLAELYRVQGEHVDRATAEWRDGPERESLREARRRLQRNTERTDASLRMAIEAAEAVSTRLPESEVLEKLERLETAAREAGTRLAARWERERAMREREREQREREAGERARAQRR